MLVVTAHELDALAHRMGIPRFPGVDASIFDRKPPREHPVLADALISSLAAQGVIELCDGKVVGIAPGGVLLSPILLGAVRVVIERTVGDTRITMALGLDGEHVVWHGANEELHSFELLAADGDPVPALVAIADPPPPEASTATGSFTTTSRRLARGVDGGVSRSLPPSFVVTLERWRATTTIKRLESVDGTARASWISIVDGGPGRVWTIEADPADGADVFAGEEPGLLVRPVADVAHRMRSWWDAAAG